MGTREYRDANLDLLDKIQPQSVGETNDLLAHAPPTIVTILTKKTKKKAPEKPKPVPEKPVAEKAVEVAVKAVEKAQVVEEKILKKVEIEKER